MEYISTSALADELDIKSSDLFDEFKALGWIERKNDKWILTDKGKQKGGQTRNSTKFGEYIVWPENISFDNEKTTKGKPKLLNSTAIGEHFNISNQRMNLVFSELGWIEKAISGWIVTQLGKTVGGRQFEDEIKGNTYVKWPNTILQNKSLKEVFSDTASEKETPTITQNQQQATAHTPENFRDNYPANFRTQDGHRVRSKAEMIIDNLLYQYGQVHAYERRLPIDETVLSDFYLPAGKVYIEYWGMENDPKYAERKKTKIEIYKKNNIQLIELNDEDIQNLDDHLPKKLLKYGIKVY